MPRHQQDIGVCLPQVGEEYLQARNRPLDCAGKRLSLSQSVVHVYSLIQQPLADSGVIQEEANLVLVTINNTAVSTW